MKLDITTVDNDNQFTSRQENLQWLSRFLRGHLAQGHSITIETPGGKLVVTKPLSPSIEKANRKLNKALSEAGYTEKEEIKC